MNRTFLIWASFALLSIFSSASARADIGFELFSWQAGREWNYAVLEGTSSARTPQALRAKGTRLRSMAFLKGRIATLPSNERLYWREDKAKGLALPPKEIIQDIDAFCRGSGIKLLLPGENSDAKAVQEMQRDAQDILGL